MKKLQYFSKKKLLKSVDNEPNRPLHGKLLILDKRQLFYMVTYIDRVEIFHFLGT